MIVEPPLFIVVKALQGLCCHVACILQKNKYSVSVAVF